MSDQHYIFLFREIVMDQYLKASERTVELYTGKYNCCEAVVLSVCEAMGGNQDLMRKICTPFGGGFAGNGITCGLLVGAYLCMGYFKGRTSEDESRLSATEPANRIYKKFIDRNGSVSCWDIAPYDRSDPQAAALLGPKYKAEVCIPNATVVTRWIMEELNAR